MATRRKARKATSRRKPAAASALKRALAERDEALKFQAATGEILKVIRGSPSDTQPVFEMIVRNAVSLCNGFFASAFRYDGERLHLIATSIVDPAARKFLAGQYPRPPDKAQMSGRAILARKVVRMEDALADPLYDRRHAEIGSWRRMLGVPMMDQGKPIGVIVVSWADAGPIPKAQEELLKTFADQAVIAIENARLFNETKSSLEQQTALGEVLRIVSRTVTDAQPTFDAILGVVLRLFPTFDATVWLVHDKHLVPVARGGPTVGRTPGQRVPVMRDYFHGGVILDRRAYSIDNVAESTELSELSRADLLSRERRAILMVPLVRQGEALGAISVSRNEPFPFSPRQVALLGNFADQAVIAIENARLFNETKEALEKETATADILQVLSGSPSDTQPVFDAIVRHAARLCESSYANVFRYDGERIHLAASEGGSKEALDALRASYPAPPNPSRAVGRVIETGRVVHVEDTLADAQYDKGFAGKLRLRRLLAVPLLRGGQPVGAITVGWAEPGPIAPRHEHLLKTFADQAVIAIENVRLFNETREALERQTATAEILKVIASSPSDVQPVFDAIVRSAGRLAEGASVNVSRVAGDRLHLAAYTRVSPAADELLRNLYPFRIANSPQIAEAIRTGTASFVADFETDPRVVPRSREVMKARGFRSTLYVPLVSGGTVHGLLHVSRAEPGPFPEQWMRLFQTFADQAVIAIENVRLFNETKEALEQQTATADILKVISSSPSDTQPVFDAIVQSATKLVPGGNPGIVMLEGGKLFHRAIAGPDMDAEARDRIAKFFPAPFNPAESPLSRSIAECTVVQIPDNEAPGLPPKYALAARAMDYRSLTFVPLVREGVGIGAVAISHSVAGFRLTEKQLALLKTFADQAVIAIENVRLFNETKEALDQQTATSEILKVIRGSPTDIQPVFDALAANAARLCEANDAILQIREADALRFVAHFGDIPNLPPGGLRPLSRDMVTGRAVLEGRQIHIADLQSEEKEFPQGRVVAKEFGYRTILATPLMREGAAIGAIMIRRKEARPFSEKHLALVKTFADQAVIAIENVRLFNETKEALEQQKASADVLSVISSSIADTAPVFEKILDSCQRLFEGYLVGLTSIEDDGLLYLRAYKGPNREEMFAIYPHAPDRASGSGCAVLERRVVHFPDATDVDIPAQISRGAGIIGFRSIIFAPMMFEGRGIGAIWVGRKVAGAFPEKQIDLLRTFADQAVIAIQNARLFREIQEKSAQLEVANKHKSDFLANMSHELRTPLNAIIGFSEVLSERMFGEVNEKQAEYLKDIHESGRHLLSLINDILDLSKIEAGRMDLELSSFDLPGAVSNAMTLVRERAQRHGIQLGLEMDPGLGELQADERKVKQILLNLLSNAVKFTPDGGKVDVSTRKADGRIEIAVRDTGIGIAPEDQAAVFEEFKQVGRDYTRKAEGTGLGLALTKRLVELHGGEISLESEPGKGSTFTVRLPLR